MPSPYFLNNGAPNFGPAAGLAGIFQQREADKAAADREGTQMLASVIQYFAGQGAANQEAGKAADATRAGMAINNGQGAGAADGASGSGMAGLVSAAGSSSNITQDGQNLKQFANMGKLADTTRSVIAGQTPSLPDQQPKIMGYTDDEWKHLGTKDKIAAAAAQKSAMDHQLAMQAYDAGQAHLMQSFAQIGAANQETAANKAFGNSMIRAKNNAALDTLSQGNGPVNPRPTTMQDFAAVADPEAWQSRQANPFLQEMAGRFRDKASEFNFDPATDVKDIGGGLKVVRTSRGGVQVVQTPESIAAAENAKLSAKSGVKFKAVPSLTDPTGFATSVEADTPEGLQHGMNLLKQGMGGGAASGSAAVPTTEDINYLKSNPGLRAQFEKKFGAGSAAQYLK